MTELEKMNSLDEQEKKLQARLDKIAAMEAELKEKETAPADHPFYYSETSGTYVLDGNLKVTGGLSCLNSKNEESCHTQEEK